MPVNPAKTQTLLEAVLEHRTSLFQYLRRRLANEEDARELAQEAFLRVLRVTRADLVLDPQAYLYRIARNLVYEQACRAMPAGRRADEGELATVVDQQQSPEDEAERAMLAERVAVALAALSPRNQAILLLFCQRGLSQREIAARVGLSKAMVQKCLAQALAHCRKQLGASEEDSRAQGRTRS